MCAKGYRRLPQGFEEHLEHVRPSWTDLGEWIRAWRTVVRDPDKAMPDPALGPEGQPIPAELNLHCPECGYGLSGLTRWRCPRCGEEFNPRRAYTLQMLKQPEYFLRYRYAPEEVRRGVLAVFLIAVGLILVSIAAFIVMKRSPGSGWISMRVGFGMLSAVSCLLTPVFILLHFLMDMSWPSVFFRFSLLWLVLCTLLLVGVVL